MMNYSMKTKGFSLIEVLVALVILSIALLALAGLMVTTTKNNSFGSHMTEAATFAQDRLEGLRVTSWDNIINGTATVPDTATGSTGITYTRNCVVVPNSGNTLMTITVTVGWNDGLSHSISLISAISPFI
jgi:type IV pilus assembly protein PilV